MVVDTVNQLPCFKDLIAVIFECLVIISLGYLSCRFKVISSEAKDLNSYLATFALPMIIFLNIAQTEFQTLNLSFLICMLAAKLLTFICVSLLTLWISHPRNYGYAGALAILATQSNDFALGYPLINSLYGDDHKREMLNYLSLQAPIQLLILNPLGIAMLEYDRSSKVRLEKIQQRRNSQLAELEYQRRNSSRSQVVCDFCLHYDRDDLFVDGQAVTSHQVSAILDQNLAVAGGTNSSGVSRNLKNLRLIMPTSGDESSNFDTQKTHRNGTNSDQSSPIFSLTDSPKKVPDCVHNDEITGREHHSHGPASLPTHCTCVPKLESISAHEQNKQSFLKGFVTRIREFNSSLSIDLSFIRALALNPLIIASIVALTVNLVHGNDLPKFVTRISHTIAASFASPALFVIGVSMCGKFELIIKNRNDLLLSCGLVMTKLLVLPSLMRMLTLYILPFHSGQNDVAKLVDFSYLYGTLPSAPTAVVIAQQYGILPNVVSLSMLLGTVVSAPLLLGSAVLINQSGISEAAFERFMSRTEIGASLISVIFASLAIYGLCKFKKVFTYINFNNLQDVAVRQLDGIRARPTHRLLLLLALSQIAANIGGLLNFLRTDLIGNSALITSSSSQVLDIQTMADFELRNDLISPIRFVISSLGLIMSRFIMLSLIVTLAASRFISSEMGNKISWVSVQIYGVMASILAISFAFIARNMPCKASEPSIPSSALSQYVRIAYNSIVIIFSIPLFATILRSESQVKSSRSCSPNYLEKNGNESHIKSSPSIASETNSDITTNTNLESQIIVGATGYSSDCESERRLEVLMGPSNSSAGPSNSFTSVKKILPSLVELDDPNQRSQSGNRLTNIHIPGDSNGYLEETHRTQQLDSRQLNSRQSNNQYEFDGSSTISEDLNQNRSSSQSGVHIGSDRKRTFAGLESSRFSVILVFLIIGTMLNLMAIVQRLPSDEPRGTYKLIEVINIAFEFGQGLLIFSVYGLGKINLGA